MVERLEALFADAYPRAVAGDGRAGEQCRRLLALMKIIPHRGSDSLENALPCVIFKPPRYSIGIL